MGKSSGHNGGVGQGKKGSNVGVIDSGKSEEGANSESRRQQCREERPTGVEQQGGDTTVGASQGGDRQQWKKRKARLGRVGQQCGERLE
ncbi:hypothetical protein B296_00011834 [Ensete ventricosum]|uniref:Uncharacterized protein n=1 Tax=Ensete ventricosum TaxID=4639 RepID=A0A427AZE2_ENSVE|nr:hypothetical protein B296_00011834 [Ensete ventricosum]